MPHEMAYRFRTPVSPLIRRQFIFVAYKATMIVHPLVRQLGKV